MIMHYNDKEKADDAEKTIVRAYNIVKQPVARIGNLVTQRIA